MGFALLDAGTIICLTKYFLLHFCFITFYKSNFEKFKNCRFFNIEICLTGRHPPTGDFSKFKRKSWNKLFSFFFEKIEKRKYYLRFLKILMMMMVIMMLLLQLLMLKFEWLTGNVLYGEFNKYVILNIWKFWDFFRNCSDFSKFWDFRFDFFKFKFFKDFIIFWDFWDFQDFWRFWWWRW